jgi:putative hemolysin
MITKLYYLENPLFLSFYCDIFYPLFLVGNTQATVLLALTVIVLLILSFFISGAEVAFFSLTYRDVNLLKTKQDSGWKRIANLLEEPNTLLASLMIANTLVNIAVIILLNVLIDEIHIINEYQFWERVVLLCIKIVVITALIVLFGEILPKVRATQNNLRFAYEASYLVEILYYLFSRIATRLMGMSESIERFMGGRVSRAYSQQQLEAAIKSTVQEEDEQRILTGIYKFGDITVKQIMRTRLDVSGVDFGLNFGEVKKRVEELHYSRLPVYKGSLDDIVGIIHTKDLLPYLNESDTFNWHTVLRNPYFVHEQKYIEDLLKEFQTRRIHFAVVVDEFGGTSGIVTLEDILEEVIGEIKDEFDEEESPNKKIDENTFIFEGGIMINDVASTMGLPSDTFNDVKGESDSLAGVILEIAGEIPKVNDSVRIGDFEFVILEVDRNRIKKVKVIVNRHAE